MRATRGGLVVNQEDEINRLPPGTACSCRADSPLPGPVQKCDASRFATIATG
jgi:hypothetical protein